MYLKVLIRAKTLMQMIESLIFLQQLLLKDKQNASVTQFLHQSVNVDEQM